MNPLADRLPLIWFGDPDAPLAWRGGRPISRRQYLADVRALAALLPPNGPMLNTSADRYRFAVGLGAALLRGQANLLPPNHTRDTVGRLRAVFADSYGLHDDTARTVDLPMVWQAAEHAAGNDEVEHDRAPPEIAAAALAAQVLTSGSTGEPLPHAKQWGLLVRNTQAGARRLAENMGHRVDAVASANRPGNNSNGSGSGNGVDVGSGNDGSHVSGTGSGNGSGSGNVSGNHGDGAGPLGAADLAGVTLVATVPAQHMYGFESTVLVALLAGAAFETERPFYPADIARALAGVPRPRLLVTTPFHLKALLDSGVALPAIDLTVCATAPLSPQLAARAEAALQAPLMEIYGCTEAGQVATRRTTAGAEWRVYDGLRLTGDGESVVVSGGHVQQPTRLADVLEVVDAQTFRLLGRSNDLINVAGKRSSLGHLNFHLNSIDGVHDGAFWLPPEADDEWTPAAGDRVVAAGASGPRRAGVQRLAAFVVAPGVSHTDILAALRQRLDPAFLPRPLVSVPALPREATGKLPAVAFAAWAARQLKRSNAE